MKDSVYKAVKKLKLSKNRKPSDIFNFIPEERLKEIKGANHVFKGEFLPNKQTKEENAANRLLNKQNRKARREHHLALFESFKKRWTPQDMRRISKKARRRYMHEFKSVTEWQTFCQYWTICRRGSEKKEKKRKKPKTRNPYLTYIHSELWESVKNGYYQRNGRLCGACGSAKKIQLHHMVYGQFGKEPDEHLIPLCDTHHKAYHDKYGTQRNMLRTTKQFIEEIKATL